jgi:hypothetical protein
MKSMKKLYIIEVVVVFSLVMIACSDDRVDTTLTMTTDDGTRLILQHSDLKAGTYHTRHSEIFGKYIDGYNLKILDGIDIVQATAADGGGYFAGIKAIPPEAPIGYSLKLFNKVLFEPQRSTSYCSGSTYAAFVEGLNLLYNENKQGLAHPQFEALCMQEQNGGRREDTVKFWGKWNDDGYGNHFALVQYSKMGKKINPINARPGDFMNISWKNGGGHSVIFLGWHQDNEGKKNLLYWSSQTRTNGLGDELVNLEKIREVMTVRLAAPDSLFTFNVEKEVNRSISGDILNW